MVDTVATSCQNGALSCSNIQCEAISKKRWLPDAIERWVPIVLRRTGGLEETTNKVYWCSTFEWAAVNYYGPYWRYQLSPNASSTLDIRLHFEAQKMSQVFYKVMEGTTPLLAPFVPELIGEDVVAEEDFEVSCNLGAEVASGRTTTASNTYSTRVSAASTGAKMA